MVSARVGPSHLAFDLRVNLQYIQPEIWRRIRVSNDVRMDRLHHILQAAFGWTNSHLHQFVVSGPPGQPARHIGDVAGAEQGGFAEDLPKTDDERACEIAEFLTKPGDRLVYEYDFGDSWHHDVVLAAVTPQTARLTVALCLDGARSCPPEDCGGPPGYEEYVAAIRDPKHPEHDAMINWNGPGFDPEKFDLAKTNRALGRIKT